MKVNGTVSWDIHQLLSNSAVEYALDMEDITIQSSIYSDYAYTNEEIRNEADRLRIIGITQRIVVERVGNSYMLLGPILPYLAMQSLHVATISCIVRSDDMPQLQQLLSMQLNASYSALSPLVYSRLIARLQRMYPVIRAMSSVNPGVKREWIACILGISSSAVLRYSYINKVPATLQLRCNNTAFPYLCYKRTVGFSAHQFERLLGEIIHYELHHPYQTISAAELSTIIDDIANSDRHNNVIEPSGVTSATETDIACDHNNESELDHLTSHEHSSSSPTQGTAMSQLPLPALYDSITMQYYAELCDSYDDRYEEELEHGAHTHILDIARKDGYMIPDQMLREISYQLYCLTRVRITTGQRLLDYACLRSILDSVQELYGRIQ